MFNLAATRPDLLTGVNPATGQPEPYGSVGVDINCAVIGYTARPPPPTSRRPHPAPSSHPGNQQAARPCPAHVAGPAARHLNQPAGPQSRARGRARARSLVPLHQRNLAPPASRPTGTEPGVNRPAAHRDTAVGELTVAPFRAAGGRYAERPVVSGPGQPAPPRSARESERTSPPRHAAVARISRSDDVNVP